MKKVIVAALTAALFASVSMAGSISIVASNKDAQVAANGVITFAGNTTARVGNTPTPLPLYQTSFVIPFRLPALTAGSTIQAVTLNVFCDSVPIMATNIIHMSILGGRVDASATVVSNDWNYGTTLAGNVESLYKVGAVVQMTAGAKAYALDSTFFRNIYANDTNAAGKHVFITLYADGINSGGANSYAVFPTADNITNSYRPTLEFTTLDTVKLIETSANSLSITEGTTNSFNVRLNLLPDAGVTVNVSRVSGGTSIAVVPDPTALVFSTANWNSWQSVYVAALVDADTSNAVAQIECVDAAGVYTSKTVSATQTDTTPVAAFTAVPTAGYAPLPVTFTDTSVGGITNRVWDFGDGVTTNTTTNKVSHTYTVAGTTSTVQLTVSGPLGGSTKTMAINVPDSMKAFPLYNSFSDEVSASAIPAGWACFAPGSNVAHSSIVSGSLSYAGLQVSAGNSWGLGEKTDDYSQDFTSPNLGTNETVYFSFLMRLNSPLNLFSSGFFHLFDRADPNGSDVSIGWGTSTTTNFTNTTTMGFSINKNVGWNSSPVKTPETYTAADTIYLLVGSYTRGTTATNGSVRLWVNPDSATFGTATPPAATLTTNSFASDAIWNRLEFSSNGSGAGVPLWQVDEMRIATSWAAVVPAASAPVADADADGLPDSWETLYFGGPTNADPNAISANGINTVLQAYIAGLNPNDPQSLFRAAVLPPNVLSWNAASGRVYSIYWTTNLMNSFQLVATNVPWTQNILTNPSPAASSFYKIDVRLQ